MRCETWDFACDWCGENLVPFDTDGLGIQLPSFDTSARFELPSDSGQRIAVVKSDLERLDFSLSHLVWVTEWGIWPSSERMHIFDRFRESYGEGRILNDAPCALFDPGESEDLVSYVTLAALFLWDVWVISGGAKQWVFYSHDQFGSHSWDE